MFNIPSDRCNLESIVAGGGGVEILEIEDTLLRYEDQISSVASLPNSSLLLRTLFNNSQHQQTQLDSREIARLSFHLG